MLTTNAPGSSGGINLAVAQPRPRRRGGNGGGGGMAGVQVTRATSRSPAAAPRTGRWRSGASASRTDEEIQIVFDRYKASFYRLYNRELRNDPTLQGQMVLRLTIEPDGSVSMCELQSIGHERAGARRSGRGPRQDDQFRREGWRAGRHDRLPDRLPAGGVKPAVEDGTATERPEERRRRESDDIDSTRF